MLNSVKFLSYSILLISVYSVLQWSSLSMTIVNNTFFWWLLQALILYNFYKIGNREIKNKKVSLFLIYVVLSFLYGLYMSGNYWHYKFLVRNTMIFLLPLSVYATASKQTAASLRLLVYVSPRKVNVTKSSCNAASGSTLLQ